MRETVRSELGGSTASRRWSRLLGLLLALGLVAAACSDSDDTTTTAGEDAATEAGGATEGGSDEEVVSGGTLRYADANGPSRFDAHRSTIGQDIRFFAPVYDRLVHLSPEGDFIPGLASEWAFSEDGLSMELKLQEGVTFHDGEPFNAAAVKANLERGKTVEGSSVANDLADITAIEAVDDTTVRLTLSQPNAILPGLFSHRAGVMISPAAFDNPDLDVAPVGAGMYRVAEYRIDDRIVYERYEDYWDTEAAGPDTIELRILADDQTRMNALQTGEVDVAYLRGTQLDEAEMSGFNVSSKPALTYLVLYLNRAKSEFGDPLVRQAMNHAVDRQGIVDAVLFGAGDPAAQPFPEGYFAHNPDYPGDFYEYDPERARELLAEAGVPDGFEFEMLVTALGVYVQAGEAIQQMLAEVGITANIRQVEAAQTADVYYAQQAGDALVSQWGGRPDPQMTMELQFTSTGFSNPGRHTTPEFEELNAQAKATLDPEERAELLREMSGAVAENAFQVPIAHDHGVFAYTDNVVNFETLITGQPNFRVIGVSQ